MKRLIALIALAGCASVDAPATTPAQDTCGASAYTYLVGKDATTLETVLILGKVRVIRPGQAITMDYWEDRLNFRIDNENRIAAVTCG